MNAEGALLPSGGYHHLRSDRVAEAFYDATAAFCERVSPKGSRTRCPPVWAGPGKSGARASPPATKFRERGLARRHDTFHRVTRNPEPETRLRAGTPALPVPDRGRRGKLRDDGFLDRLARLAAEAAPETAANTLLCAAHQATYLLRRQLEAQEREFLAHGGFTERLYSARSASRKSDVSDVSDKKRIT